MTMDNIIRENELELFYEKLSNNLTVDTQKILHTIDYLNLSQPNTKRRTPTCLHFCEALLMEILCNTSPDDKLWDKVKYAAFLLNLANRNVEFDLLYKIFYQIEDCVLLKNLSWNSDKISDEFTNIVIENLFVKEDVDMKNINKEEPFDAFDDANESDSYADADFDLFNGATANYTQEENSGNFIDFFNYNVDNMDMKDSSEIKEEKLPKKRKRGQYNKRKKIKKVEHDVDESQADVKTSSEIIDENIPKKRKRGPYKKRKKVDYGIDDDLNENEADDKTKDSDWNELKGNYLFCTENDCRFKTTTNYDLEKHIFNDHESNRLCLQCGYLADSFKDYLDHKETHIFTCDICNQVTLGAKSLRYHKTKIHGKFTTKQEKVEKSNEDKDRVPCTICGVVVLRACLTHHMNQIHSTEVHKCDVCDFTTNTKSKLNVHRKNHFSEILTCPECGKLIKGAKSLRRHFIHTCPMRKNKQVFDCDLCDKKFQSKVSLNNHTKFVHQKIKGIQCQLCDYQTYSSFNLKVHLSKSHTKEDMLKTCSICEIKTMGLDYHMKTYHFDVYMKKKDLDEPS